MRASSKASSLGSSHGPATHAAPTGPLMGTCSRIMRSTSSWYARRSTSSSASLAATARWSVESAAS